ncbi:hypothetical protein OS493_017506 [Desmophyllum pertusum]|uniref:Uncharacterized protein n=1 Tax=Desmophyllum pertusum TaxID=174260 RepID=A0A9W9ZPK6_9CNID|nr:hypothetical protein OS493_017506 [Desmophyllum pertusum]
MKMIYIAVVLLCFVSLQAPQVFGARAAFLELCIPTDGTEICHPNPCHRVHCAAFETCVVCSGCKSSYCKKLFH